MHLIYLLIRVTSILKNDKNRLNKIRINNNKLKSNDIISNNFIYLLKDFKIKYNNISLDSNKIVFLLCNPNRINIIKLYSNSFNFLKVF